jgi:hypothetical protein
VGAIITEAVGYTNNGLTRIYSRKVLVVVYKKYIFNNVALYSQFNNIKLKIYLNYVNPNLPSFDREIVVFSGKHTTKKISVIFYWKKKTINGCGEGSQGT